MLNGFRYIQTDETGFVTVYCADPVVIDGVTITIDTEGMTVPEMPTDAVYDLYYNEEQGLHWVKVADFEPETPEEPTDNVTWDDMAAAINEGVNEV